MEEALGVTDPSPIDMLSLTSLSARSRGISSLAGLEYARNLQELSLGENQISDISPLSGLMNLREMSLDENHINDISPLSGHTNLRELSLGENQVSDISYLSGLTRLSRLVLHQNNISDINALSTLSNLITLNLFGNQINDINALSTLTNLEFIYLSGNQITNVEALSTLTKLRFLSLSRNNITDIAPLSALIDLDGLYLESNQITDISALENLTNLKGLALGSNQIADISVLSVLTQLDSLDLGENQITDISVLASLTNLISLHLHYNQIRNISPLSDLANLQILSLNNNQISDISPLSGLIGLEKLSLDDNQISDISPLFGLTNLNYLGLRSNPLNIEAYTTYIPRLHRFGTNVFYDPLVWRTLTISSTAGGSVVEPGEGEFDYMDEAVVSVSAVADEGYYFVNWTGTAVYEVADPAAAGTTVTMEEDFTLRANFERIRLTLYVDDNAPNDSAPNDPRVSDPSEDGSSEHPYDTIQEAIDVAEHGDTVLVYPGVYQEEVIFMGKTITVQGVAASDGIPVLENPDDFAVSFYFGEGPDSILKNFVIRNSFMAVFIASSSPTISNLTVVNNKYGIEAYAGSEPDISNSIFWNNTDGDLFQCQASFSWIEENIEYESLEGLISHWMFDEGSGTTVYDSAGDNHGVIYGAQWTIGQVNGALSFDGEDDYVELPDNNPIWLPQYDFSLSAWVSFERDDVFSSSESEVILDLNFGASSNPANELGYNIQRRGDSGKLCFQITTTTNSDEDLYSNEVLATKTWYHIVAVRDGGTQAIYINGRLDAARTCSTDPIDFVGGYDDDNVNIGRFTTNIGNPRYHLKGQIDDVMIFGSALSGETIRQLYQSGLTGQGFAASPLFVDPNSGDYHLRSKRGRHWPEHDVWVLDNVNSPCIDAGNPMVTTSEEPMPNGGRINMGAYGGTAYASMSESSITSDELPLEIVEQVHVIAGDFQDEDSTWFIAMFHNDSDYTITQVTVNIRLTDEETGEQEWYEVVLGPPEVVIQPGETVILSGDVGVTGEDRDLYWEVARMTGYIN